MPFPYPQPGDPMDVSYLHTTNCQNYLKNWTIMPMLTRVLTINCAQVIIYYFGYFYPKEFINTEAALVKSICLP